MWSVRSSCCCLLLIFIFSVIDVGSEWRTFSNEKSATDRSRVGAAEVSAHYILYYSCTVGKFDEVFNLGNWRFFGKLPNFKIHQCILMTGSPCLLNFPAIQY